MTEDWVRNNWEDAFDQVEHGDELSAIVDYGFDADDLLALAELHKNKREYRKKIEELLTDCNYHTECKWLTTGDYDKFSDGAFDEEAFESLCDKADAELKKVISFLKDNSEAFGAMNLKLYNAAFDIDYDEYPIIRKVIDAGIMGRDYDPFYEFCEQEYDNMKEHFKEQGIDFDKMTVQLGRTSSFYLHDGNVIDVTRPRGRYDDINIQATIDNLVEQFAWPDFEANEDGLVDREYAKDWWDSDEDIEENLKYIASGDLLKDTKEYCEDILKVYEYIKSFKDNQVEYFKSWLEGEAEWLEANYADELAEVEEESKSISSVAKVTNAILEGRSISDAVVNGLREETGDASYYEIVYGYQMAIVKTDWPTSDYGALVDILIDNLEKDGVKEPYLLSVDQAEAELNEDEYVIGGNHGLALVHNGNFNIVPIPEQDAMRYQKNDHIDIYEEL